MLHQRTKADTATDTRAITPGGRRRRMRGMLAAGALVGSLGVVGLSAAPGGTAHATPCHVTGGVWAPVVIRSLPSTGAGTDTGARINAGVSVDSSCSVITGGSYTACSSAGTSENRWIPLAGGQAGNYVAWRCVGGPYAG